MRSASEILDDIKKWKGITSDADLARIFDVKPSTVTTWRTRDSVPFDLIVAFCEREGFDIHAILTGQERAVPGVHKIADEHRDPVLISLLEKLQKVYKDGTIQQRAMLRGLIDEMFDEVMRGQAERKKRAR